MRLIDAEALEESIEQIEWYHLARNGEMVQGATSENGWYKEQDIYNAIEEAPTADVAPVVHGHWIEKEKYSFGIMYDCSLCDNRILDNGYSWNYCPNCGAKMDEKEDR